MPTHVKADSNEPLDRIAALKRIFGHLKICAWYDLRPKAIGKTLLEDFGELGAALVGLVMLAVAVPCLLLKAVFHIPTRPLFWLWYVFREPVTLDDLGAIMMRRKYKRAWSLCPQCGYHTELDAGEDEEIPTRCHHCGHDGAVIQPISKDS